MTVQERIPYAAQRTVWALQDSGKPLCEEPDKIFAMLAGRALYLYEHNDKAFAPHVRRHENMLDIYMQHWAKTFTDPMNMRGRKLRGLYRVPIVSPLPPFEL